LRKADRFCLPWPDVGVGALLAIFGLSAGRTGVLFAFGLAMLVCGVYYRTPMPVQPMKAIVAVAATQAAQSRDPRRHSLHHRSAACAGVLRFLEEQGRALRDSRHRRASDVERGSRVRRRISPLRGFQTGLPSPVTSMTLCRG